MVEVKFRDKSNGVLHFLLRPLYHVKKLIQRSKIRYLPFPKACLPRDIRAWIHIRDSISKWFWVLGILTSAVNLKTKLKLWFQLEGARLRIWILNWSSILIDQFENNFVRKQSSSDDSCLHCLGLALIFRFRGGPQSSPWKVYQINTQSVHSFIFFERSSRNSDLRQRDFGKKQEITVICNPSSKLLGFVA